MERPLNTVTIDFNVDDDFSSIRAMMARLVPFSQSSCGSLLIDLSLSQYLGPDAAVVLTAFVKLLQFQSVAVEVRLPSHGPLAGFCEFSGLRQQFEGSAAPDPTHPDCVTVPLRFHNQARLRDVEPIERLVRAYVPFSEDRASALQIAFSEVLQNVEDHAKSEVGAISCARLIASRNEVRVAVVDMGLGIVTTLSKRHPQIGSGGAALGRVMAGGWSAMSRRNNAGLGLNNLLLCVTRTGGRLFVISESGGFLADRHDHRTVELDFRFPGTGIFFTLPTSG